jgi:hypothetical protein
MKTIQILLIFCTFVGGGAGGAQPETRRLMLSGNGPSDAVEWNFEVTAGRRAGEKARIPVPSQWEQHGFGDYDYGTVPAKDKHKEDGIYQRGFVVPADWRGQRVRIVFEGAMTDTSVSINGQSAGPVHQGGFYRFHHDITDKVVFGGENRLEVRVSKDSENPTVEQAERQADYWVFGGIYRPVWLEARPPQAIEWTAIDAGADGGFRAKVHLEGSGAADRVVVQVAARDGGAVGSPMEAPVGAGGVVELAGMVAGVKPWSAEEPNLYQVEISLMKGDVVVHRTTERVGFRTLESRAGQGVFVNGRRITVKGVNRHCFRPASGRALDPQDSIADVKLIKSMNMNAVRCSHYPPDKAFLDACDELGLYVENEICTWQKPVLDTATAKRVIGQMIRRDVNHPSILWWANGNEGGWNTEADGDFAIWDIQQRPVLHPWEEFSGYQTKHYPTWERLQQDLADKYLVMPTEYLHGLFDGGHGAGLEDYWNAIISRPNGVGGFLWVLADEGIERTDRNREIDNWGINAPDGIVGPRHEKEASYLTAKDIFNPAQIAMKRLPGDFDGKIPVRNRYDFRNLSSVRFEWRLGGFNPAAGGFDLPGEEPGGEVQGPAVPPGETGILSIPLPQKWRNYSLLELHAKDAEGDELWKWSWPVPGYEAELPSPKIKSAGPAKAVARDGLLTVTAGGGAEFMFDATSGLLGKVSIDGSVIPLSGGPLLAGGEGQNRALMDAAKILKATASGSEGGNVAANAVDGRLETRWSQAGRDEWILLEFAEPTVVDALSIAWQHAKERKAKWMLELSEDGMTWTKAVEGASRPEHWDGDTHRFSARKAAFARLRCFGNDRNEWNSILELKVGGLKPMAQAARFTANHRMLESGACRIEAKSAGPFKSFAWTVHPDGLLDLEYCYEIDHPTAFHGITFDLPEDQIKSLSWTGQGPERVWANRMRGTWFGSFERGFRKLRPGIDYGYPHSAGYYADVRAAGILTKSGAIRLRSGREDTFLRIGTNDEGEKITTFWPEGGFSVLHAIPAIGNKFHKPGQIGPQSGMHAAPGEVSGKVSFRFEK